MTQNGNLLVFIPARYLNLIEINYYLSNGNSPKQITLTRTFQRKNLTIPLGMIQSGNDDFYSETKT